MRLGARGSRSAWGHKAGPHRATTNSALLQSAGQTPQSGLTGWTHMSAGSVSCGHSRGTGFLAFSNLRSCIPCPPPQHRILPPWPCFLLQQVSGCLPLEGTPGCALRATPVIQVHLLSQDPKPSPFTNSPLPFQGQGLGGAGSSRSSTPRTPREGCLTCTVTRSPVQMSCLIREGRSAASGAGGRRGGREDAHSSQRFTSGLCSSVF